MNLLDWFRDKITRLINRLAPVVRESARKAEVVALTLKKHGDAIAAYEPEDIPYLYGPVVDAVIKAQTYGNILGVAGVEKLVAVKAALVGTREGVRLLDTRFDQKWVDVYVPFIEAFIETAKELQEFGFKRKSQ